MFVDSALLSDVKRVFGQCEGPELFRRLSDAVKLGTDQGKMNDWNVSILDLCVCDGCVTLPAEVDTILGVNQGGQPTLIRDEWFQFHFNGSGSVCWAEWPYTDELGRVSTYRDPSKAVYITAVVENASDSGKLVRVFGWEEDGKRIYTPNGAGVLEDGFLVPTAFGFSTVNPNAPAIARIERVSKELSNGFIRLVAVDPDDNSVHTQIGYYMPWETVPYYRRIRVPDKQWIRIKYKRKDIEVRGEGDWINLNNREALLLLCKAVRKRLDDQIDQAQRFENEGLRLLAKQAEALRPTNTIDPPQIIFTDVVQTRDTLFY